LVETHERERMKKSLVLPLIAVLVAACVVAVFVLKSKKEMRAAGLNLLFITIDTCRADHLGAYGSRTARTPVMDDLASRGILFENCYTPVPLTLPSHCSMFTGRYPIGHNVRNNGSYFLDPSQMTLAEKMKEQGYQTAAVVGAFVLLSKFGLNHGFDFYDDTLDTHKIYNNFSSEISASEVLGKFRRWFARRDDRKFFAWLHFYDPHAPYTPPQDFAAQFKNDTEGLYSGEVAFVDFTIGQLIKDLENKGILGQTLVVICGDHGEAFGEHREFKHGVFCYEEVLKVPLIFYNPRLFPEARSVRQRVNLVDLFPTLCELYGLDTPKSVQGLSLVGLLQGRPEKTERTFYIESMFGKEEMNWAPLTGLLSSRYKYISLPQPELYDLDYDKEESHNLVQERNDLVRKLDGDLRRLVTEFSDRNIDSRRKLTAEDRERLQALGYISSSSNKSSKAVDPKTGIVLDNETRACYDEAKEGNADAAETRLKELVNQYSGVKTPALYDAEYLIRMKKNQKREAMDVLKRAMADFPRVDRFYVLYALNAFQMNEDQDAELKCRELLKVNPLFSSAYIILGEISVRKKQIPAAISYFRRALEIEPQNILLKIKYTELLISQEDYVSAMTAYEELLENEDVQRDSGLLFKIGLFTAKYGKSEKAEELMRRAIELEPRGKYYFYYALILAKNNKVEEALKNMEMGLSQHGNELSAEQRQIAQKAIQMWKR